MTGSDGAVDQGSGWYTAGKAAGWAWFVAVMAAWGAEGAAGEGIADGVVSSLTAEEETFEILDGVRRTKAMELLGQQSIEANIFDAEGSLLGTRQVPISALRSPKEAIDLSSSQVNMDRWMKTWDLTKGGSPPPPIAVTPGKAGIPIKNVVFH
jgi:hypothetical protein